MLRLILAFVDILLHRRGPQDVPSSRFLFWLLLATSLGIELAVESWLVGSTAGIAVVILVTGFDIWFVWAVLRLFNREARFRQTMTALFGTATVLSVLRLPVVPFIELPTTEPQQLTIPGLVMLLVLAWSIDVHAYVFSRAIERPYVLCMAIVIAYVFLIVILDATLRQPVA